MLQAISDIGSNISALKTQIAALVSAADGDKAALATQATQITQLQNQVSQLQQQVSAGALAADDSAALTQANTDLQALTQQAADAAAKDSPAN